MAESVPIPEPPGLPFIGNLGEFSSSPLQDLIRLSKTYGEIYRLRFGSRPQTFVSSYELVAECCDEKRFKKTINGTLGQVRNGVHDGLFTADLDEPNWGKAHRILVPAFGPLSIRSMFDEMHDISSQLAMKIARHGPTTPIPASDDFTKLALDTLALCSMDYRFNSFYHEDLHPFVQAMGDFLTECGVRNKRPSFAPSFLYRAADEKYQMDIDTMRDVADTVVKNRKENPSDRKDLLNAMLAGVDPQDGQKLSDANITDQLITFLIAGHETTSGMLSFAFYHLLKNPAAYRKVQQEVDEVIGREKITIEHMTKLPYIAAILRETLRLSSSIAAIGVEPYEDTLVGGKYFVPKGEPIILLLTRSHLDHTVYGEDAEVFNPDRMLDENFARLQKEFPNCWKPFGNGQRACIGRPFAWQEAVLAMAMMIQNFNFTFDDPNYVLKTQETLTVKPKEFNMRATLRHNMTATELEQRLAGKGVNKDETDKAKNAAAAVPAANRKPMAVYYGSNSGTCEALAQRVAADAPQHGFDASILGPLDSANQELPKDRPVVIVTASYEGQAPSNAAHFVDWIESLKGKEMEGVSYSVFGCGHHDWAQTFHRIPKLVDAKLAELGGERLTELATTDAADSDMFGDFETWEDESFWPAVKTKFGGSDDTDAAGAAPFTVEVTTPRQSTLRQDVEEAVVLDTRTLSTSGATKNHIEIQLPTGMTYKAGDYLAVLPFNPKAIVSRVFRRFQLCWDSYIKITADRPTALPTGTAVSANDILTAYVELSQPATRRNIAELISATEDKDTIAALEKLAGDDHQEQVTAKRLSVLDLLERFPTVNLPFGAYLAMLPPMRVRQYSISSSPLADPTKLTLTYSVLNQPALSGQGDHVGVTTNFLSLLHVGDKLHVSVRPSVKFHLPTDAENVPLIGVAAGSGLAPFRGFVQERAAMIAAGRKVAPAILFFGCRSPDADDLYAEEFARWEQLGAVEVRRAYSRDTEKSEGCKYVQDRMYHDREDIYKLWDMGAKIYVCGSRDVGKGIEDACIAMIKESGTKKLAHIVTDEEARAWFEKYRNERYLTDVFD
ncbi:hypothetical protein VHEMI00520 [[Torrubiella] hemipterigena]|nr:hypothetical protein VHEMI00520 [[Torrubiella] hemipterigena]